MFSCFGKSKKVSAEKKLTRSGSSAMLTSNKLLNHVRDGNWDLALDRLARKPQDIEGRYLFLHEALKNKAPFEVIKALHEARPTALYHREQTHGMMALHVACERGLSLDVVQYLHEQHPTAAHEACSSGMLPLHLACVSHACRIPVICYLLSVYPEAMNVKDDKGEVPLTYIEHSSHPHQQILYREFERGMAFWAAKELHDPEGCPLSLLICERKFDEAMDRVMKFPEEGTIWSVYKNSRMLPIHYACKYKAPLAVIAELVELHPYGLALTCQEYDMTALHLACQHGATVDIIQALLQGHSSAASHSDDLGLLPLHLACAQGASIAVVEALLRAHPEAISMVDAKGYTPLVYAEASKHPHSKYVLKLLMSD